MVSRGECRAVLELNQVQYVGNIAQRCHFSANLVDVGRTLRVVALDFVEYG